jgi:hypothetical protein
VAGVGMLVLCDVVILGIRNPWDVEFRVRREEG